MLYLYTQKMTNSLSKTIDLSHFPQYVAKVLILLENNHLRESYWGFESNDSCIS